MVDQGGFVDTPVYVPGPTRNRLRWVEGQCQVDPFTGASQWQRGGLAWVPEQRPGTTTVARFWQPNVVAQQVPVTQFVQRVVVEKVPVQTVRFVDEQQVRKVPVQTCRIVQEEQVRRIPVTTYRQVVERVEQQIPVQVCRMVEEEVVRKIPVTVERMVMEERVEPVQVQVCRMVTEERVVQEPRVVETRVPVTYTIRTPRTVVMRIPLDPCGNEIVEPDCAGSSVLPAPATSTFVTPSTPTPAAPRAATPSEDPEPAPVNRTPVRRPTTDSETRPSLAPDEPVPGPVDEEAE
jgi:hypothetical protein